jgi:hypothetical protein
MTTAQILSLCKHANRKAHYYLDRMNSYPVFSGKHIDAGVRAEQYSDYLYRLLKEAQQQLTRDEYSNLCRSIAD